MHFTPFAAAALALVQAALAAPSSPVTVRDAHKADFRSFGVAGCSEDNQGVWTLLESDNNVCKPFGFTIGSILVASDDCALYLYTDTGCTTDETATEVKQCASGNWGSFKLVCST